MKYTKRLGLMILILGAGLSGCGSGPSDRAGEAGLLMSEASAETRLRVSTVDEQGQPMAVDTVRWWVQGHRSEQRSLECVAADCFVWEGEAPGAWPVVVRADASRPHAGDSECSDLFAKEQVFEEKTQEIRLVLEPAGTVCR